MSESPQPGPFIAGFEASTMRRRDGRRLDLVAATRHDVFADADYRRMLDLGIRWAREGTAWHRIEETPGRFEPASVIGRIRAAQRLGIRVIWDLCHFGWPDDVDVFDRGFPDRLARYAARFARLLREESDGVPWFVPVNEPSFVAWAGGDVEYLNPFERGRGDELKRQLVRASIAAAAAVRAVDPRSRICHVDPLIHIVPNLEAQGSADATRRHNEAQYAAWDMLEGRIEDELGGSEAELDVIGVNLYDRNQWIDGGPTLEPGAAGYRPVREMLAEAYARYRRPMIVAETGREGDAGPDWLRYITGEVLAARAEGVQVDGVCLYPVTDYPGWDDDRHVRVGLWGNPDEAGQRPANAALVEAVRGETPRLELSESVARPRETPKARRANGAKRRPVVVLATESRAPSGMGRQMLTLARGLADEFDVIVACPDAVDARWLLSAAADEGVEAWPLVDGSVEAQAASLRDRLASVDAALVNVHAGIGWEGHELAAAARRSGRCAILRHEHLPYLLTKPRDRARYEGGLANVDGLIAVSAGVAASYAAAGVRPALIHVVRNGIEDPAPRGAHARAAQDGPGPLSSGRPCLVSVGRLTDQKGYDVLLTAMAAVRRQRPDAQLLIVGSGRLAGTLSDQAASLGLSQAVRFERQRDDVPALIASSMGVVLASRFEGLPLVALEAMALGVPVIGTAVCGVDEVVDNGVTGWLVPPEAPAALEAAMIDLLANPAEASRRGQAGRTRYEALFTARRMADETAAVFRAYLTAQRDDRGPHQPRDDAYLVADAAQPRATAGPVGGGGRR